MTFWLQHQTFKKWNLSNKKTGSHYCFRPVNRITSTEKQPLTDHIVYQHIKRCEHITPETIWHIYKTDE